MLYSWMNWTDMKVRAVKAAFHNSVLIWPVWAIEGHMAYQWTLYEQDDSSTWMFFEFKPSWTLTCLTWLSTVLFAFVSQNGISKWDSNVYEVLLYVFGAVWGEKRMYSFFSSLSPACVSQRGDPPSKRAIPQPHRFEWCRALVSTTREDCFG